VVIVGFHLPSQGVEPGIPRHRQTRRAESGAGEPVRCSRYSRRIGWSGPAGKAGHWPHRQTAVGSSLPQLIGVTLAPNDVLASYRLANGWLNPALDGANRSLPMSSDWQIYRKVNECYAEATLREARTGDLIWIHDYHLMLVPRMVRDRHPSARIGFFLHVPFRPVGTFMQVAFAPALIDGVLGADCIEVETPEFAANLLAAVASVGTYRVRASVVEEAGRRVCVFARRHPSTLAFPREEADVNRCE